MVISRVTAYKIYVGVFYHPHSSKNYVTICRHLCVGCFHSSVLCFDFNVHFQRSELNRNSMLLHHKYIELMEYWKPVGKPHQFIYEEYMLRLCLSICCMDLFVSRLIYHCCWLILFNGKTPNMNLFWLKKIEVIVDGLECWWKMLKTVLKSSGYSISQEIFENAMKFAN